MTSVSFAIDFDDIIDASRRIASYAIRTPVFESDELNAICGRRVLIKFEGAQRTGSFKFRGAFNRLARLDQDSRGAGVVAWSGGNHAQGVAAAARILDIAATIVMPSDAPVVKLANTRRLGANIVTYDRLSENREDIAIALAASQGATLVPSYDDPDIIAGQGTVGLELLDQAFELGIEIDQVLVPCGGGGLAAGVATAIKTKSPNTQIYIVEPDGYDDTVRSIASGSIEMADLRKETICDALRSPTPGKLTFPINNALVAGGLVVTDDMVLDAIRFAAISLKLVAEPGGAVALAAVIHGLLPNTAGPCAVIISGSNIDPSALSAIMRKSERQRGIDHVNS